MASLETLELHIKANAGDAVDRINNLITSLTSLGNAIQQPLRKLTQLNHQLKVLASYGVKVKNITGTGKALKATAYDPATNNNRTAINKGASSFNEAEYNKRFQESVAENRRRLEQTRKINDANRERVRQEREARDAETRNLVENASKVDLLTEKYNTLKQTIIDGAKSGKLSKEEVIKKTLELKKVEEQLQKEIQKQQNATGIPQAAEQTQKLGDEAKKSTPKVSQLGQTLSQIGRIAKTLAIRTALRNMMKAFGEAWSAAYSYSKSMGGDFAKNVEYARGALASVSTNLITAFAPALNIIVPILNVVVNAVKYLCDLLQQLWKWLGLTSELFGASSEAINKYAGSSSKGTKATKNLLASFDQLNVIQSQSGGGGSGSGGSGQKSFFSDMVSDEMAKIQVIVGTSMIALGLILACAGKIGLGIGLIALGAAAIVKTVTVDWGKLSADTKREINKIMLIAGGALLAIGAILAFSGANIPLGIGMMIAGGIDLAATVALNWSEISNKIKRVFRGVGEFLKKTWNDVTGAINGAWESVSNWWSENVTAGFEEEGVWGGVKGFFMGLFGENGIPKWSSDALNSVNDWVKTNIGVDIKGAWEGVGDFFKGLFGDTEIADSIAGYANNAWITVQDWWETNIVQNVKDAWNGITEFFKNLWGNSEEGTGICGFFNTMWNSISRLWGDITTSVKTAWEGLGVWFHDFVTAPIANFFIDCVNGIIDGINSFIGFLNSINITIPAVSLPLVGQLWGETKVGISGIAILEHLAHVALIGEYASGGYGIPSGDLFLANEAGAELVGSMNGKTTVANQQQIVEGIRMGVRDANSEQNQLLRRQNELLMGILQKNNEVTPSADWGRFIQQSADMWDMVTGG